VSKHANVWLLFVYRWRSVSLLKLQYRIVGMQLECQTNSLSYVKMYCFRDMNGVLFYLYYKTEIYSVRM